MISPLAPDKLARRCDPSTFDFVSTADLPPIDEVVGQDRAVEAVGFGVGIHRRGYNLFAMGPEGLGKYRLVRQVLLQRAPAEPVPSDWCYVHDFGDPRRPRAVRLAPGEGRRFRDRIATLDRELRSAIPAAFDSDEYRNRRQALESDLKERRDAAFVDFERRAAARSIALLRTPIGVGLAALKDGKVIDREEIERLPDAEQTRMKEALGELEEGLGELIQRTFPRWERETRSAIRDASETVTRRAVGHLIDEVRREYRDAPEILAHLDAMETDVIANAEEFLAAALPAEAPALLAARISDGSTFRRYQVNLIVDRTDQVGAPVVFEDLPTEPNLVGRVEHAAHLGALVTDVTLIRPGALHRANGGYLVLDARRLLGQPLAWDALKRALRGDEIRIESPGERLGLIATASLEPQPIPLDVKVVLIGDRVLYHLLADLDPDFLELFKVQVDFEEEIPRTLETEQRYARLFGTIAAGDGLRPLEPGGAAAIVEHASRLAGDAERLSTHMRRLTDVLREADDHAARAERTTIGAGDVDSAIAAGRRRAARLHERSLEDMTRGTLLVRTTGEAVGVANGLSVISLGESSFGRPSRITARVRLGDGEVVDIEREVDLGGPLHSKGVLILAGFVGGRYGRERPLSVRASLVFEQSYGGVEGDSATLAETCALLSALGEVPIRQSIAMTGSLDQQGDIQPVGGLDEKIEGFFEICAVRGLDGSQGVIIPAANVANLMLRPEVVEAARRGRFSIWAVATIDEALEILTGRPAGKADRSGRYPDGSVNGLVVAGLSAMAERARAFARGSVPTSTDDGRRRATRVPARGARKEPVGSPTVPGPSVP